MFNVPKTLMMGRLFFKSWNSMHISKFHLISFAFFLCASFVIKDNYKRKYVLKMLTLFVKGLNDLERQGFKWFQKEIEFCLVWWKGRCFLAPEKHLKFFLKVCMSANKVWVFGFYDSHQKTLVFRSIWMPTKFKYLCFLIATRKYLLLDLYECH
jgi:hypothetical protein